MIVKQSGRFGFEIPGRPTQRLAVVSSAAYAPSPAKSIIESLEREGRTVSLETHPTIETLINTFFAFYAFADKRPDGTLKLVETDIILDEDAIEWLRMMHDHYRQPFPDLHARTVNAPAITRTETSGRPVSMLSGGKDSTYLALSKGTLPLHIAKINKSTASREIATIARLDGRLPESPRIVPLINSLRAGEAADRYELRDILLYTLALPLAFRESSPTIYAGSYEEGRWYSATGKALSTYNDLLRTKGIGTTVEQITTMREETLIERLVKEYPGMLELTSPCIYSDERFRQWRNWFTKRFPSFPLGEGSCGVCGKDVQLNMSRLLHDPKVLELSLDERRDVAAYCVSRAHSGRTDDFIEQETVKSLKEAYHLRD
jgi:hypothetical protein